MTTITDFSIDEVKTTQNGAKVANIEAGDGNALEYLAEEFLTIPFEPSTFIESTSSRKDLVINITEEMRKDLARLDAMLIVYISEHSERLLKKRLSLEQVRAAYTPCVRTAKDYPPSIKTKVELGEGKYAVACWDECGESIAIPCPWRDFVIKPRIVVSNLWMFSGKFGPVLRTTDVLLQPKPESQKTERCSPFKPI